MGPTEPPNPLTGSAYRTADMNWQEMRGILSGVEVKILCMEVRTGANTMLVKVLPGGRIFSHRHDSDVQHFLIEGGYKTRGQVFETGTYRLIPRDTEIPSIDSQTGVTFFLISDPPGEGPERPN